jgi:hypothetical protein
VEKMIVLSKCGECKRLVNSGNIHELPKCEAFPNGIPFEVFKSLESVPCSDALSFERAENEG